MRIKLLVLLTTFAIAGMIGPSTAKADQITLGDSCSGTLSLSLADPISVDGSVSNCAAFWEQGATNSAIGVWGYDGSTTNFTVTGQGAYSAWGISGTVNWTGIGIQANCFSGVCGNLTVSSVTGFNGEFTQGGDYFIDLAFKPGGSLDGNTIFGLHPSSGEVLVPEPGSLMLFGTGLLSMAGFLRRKLFSA